MNNYFNLFELPQAFRLDTADLERRYKFLQAEHHPDRFAGADDGRRLQALQQTSLINDAYETLRSPLKRAAHLLSLQGVDPEEHNQAHFGPDFLLRQMELRERLESLADSEDIDGLESMKTEVGSDRERLVAQFEELFSQGDYAGAKQQYNRLQFLCKLLDEIDAVEEKLLDY